MKYYYFFPLKSDLILLLCKKALNAPKATLIVKIYIV